MTLSKLAFTLTLCACAAIVAFSGARVIFSMIGG